MTSEHDMADMDFLRTVARGVTELENEAKSARRRVDEEGRLVHAHLLKRKLQNSLALSKAIDEKETLTKKRRLIDERETQLHDIVESNRSRTETNLKTIGNLIAEKDAIDEQLHVVDAFLRNSPSVPIRRSISDNDIKSDGPSENINVLSSNSNIATALDESVLSSRLDTSDPTVPTDPEVLADSTFADVDVADEGEAAELFANGFDHELVASIDETFSNDDTILAASDVEHISDAWFRDSFVEGVRSPPMNSSSISLLSIVDRTNISNVESDVDEATSQVALADFVPDDTNDHVTADEAHSSASSPSIEILAVVKKEIIDPAELVTRAVQTTPSLNRTHCYRTRRNACDICK